VHVEKPAELLSRFGFKMRFSCFGALLLGLAQSAYAQNGGLGAAIASYKQLSTFQGILQANPSFIGTIIPDSTTKYTVLIPNDDAFMKYANQTNQTLTSMPVNTLLLIFKYHVMAAEMTKANSTTAQGLIVPTLLKDERYNNRTPGDALINAYGADAAAGQVLFVSRDPINPVKLRVRQNGNLNLRGGKGLGAGLQLVDGQWNRGYFQIVDTYVLPGGTASRKRLEI
jgi:hypothetical protein